MKKWIKILVIIAIIIIIVFIAGVEIIYNSFVDECCSCCDDSAEICISACCKCNYNIFEKIERIFNYSSIN